MLLQQVGQVLHGTAEDPTWHIGSGEERPVLKLFSCMISGGRLVGNIYAYLRGMKREETHESSCQNHNAISLPIVLG